MRSMPSSSPLLAMQSLRRSWTSWLQRRREKRLRREIRRLERIKALEADQRLRVIRLEQRVHPLLQVALPSLESPPLRPDSLPATPDSLPEVPPPLTPEEIAELKGLPMPDPVQEIEHRLGLST